MIIIGIAGYKNSGKSTFGSHLSKHFSNNMNRVVTYAPFARPLKLLCQAVFGDAHWWGTDEQKSKVVAYWSEVLGEEFSTARRILQTVATDKFRNTINKDIWIHAQRVYLKQLGAPDVVIVDDVRFENEADFIRNSGGSLIHISRLDTQAHRDAHESEAGVVKKDTDYSFAFLTVAAMDVTITNLTQQLIKKQAKL